MNREQGVRLLLVLLLVVVLLLLQIYLFMSKHTFKHNDIKEVIFQHL